MDFFSNDIDFNNVAGLIQFSEWAHFSLNSRRLTRFSLWKFGTFRIFGECMVGDMEGAMFETCDML